MRERNEITKMLEEIEKKMKEKTGTDLSDKDREELVKIQQFMDLVIKNKAETFEGNKNAVEPLQPYIKILSHVIAKIPELQVMCFSDTDGMVFAIVNTALISLVLANKIEIKE